MLTAGKHTQATGEASRDLKIRCRKRGNFAGSGDMDVACGEIKAWMSILALPCKIPPFSGSRRPPDQSREASPVAVGTILRILKLGTVYWSKKCLCARIAILDFGRGDSGEKVFITAQGVLEDSFRLAHMI